MADVFNRFAGARSVYGMKKPCRAATTTNIVLSGFQVVDGITYALSDEAANLNMRILVKDQTDTTANGIYIVQSGVWARDKDFDGNTDYTAGSSVFVSQGTVNGGRIFTVSSSDPQSIGIAATSFSRLGLDRVAEHGADIPSTATLNLNSATGEIVDVTGVATISSITLSDGRIRIVRFTGALTLTNGANLVLPGGQSITTAAGDYAMFVGYPTSVVRCVAYSRYDGHPLITLVPAAAVASAATTNLGTNIAQCQNVSGNVTITSFGTTAPTGAVKFVEFSGTPLITHNGTSLILQGAQNIQVIAGDCIILRHEGSGNWRELSYRRANSHPLTTGSASLSSASTVDLGSVREQYITVSGAVSITSFGSSAPTGAVKYITFSGAPLLTYNATSMMLPSSGNIQIIAGDTAVAVHEGAGNWRVVSFTRAQPRGVLSVNTTPSSTPTSTSGSTSESSMMTYALPASAMAANGYGIRVSAWGVTAATTTTKEIKAYFGGTVLFDTGSILLNNHAWKFNSTIIRTSSSAQVANTVVYGSSATILPSIVSLSTPAEALSTGSTAITIKITGICTSTGAAEITQGGMTVELIGAF